jgi:hypothetical protein
MFCLGVGTHLDIHTNATIDGQTATSQTTS